MFMKRIEKRNTTSLVTSCTITKIGDVLFDYANNAFLAGINLNSLTLVGIYQSLESVMGIIFNLFGGVIADNFRRKKILILTDLLSGIICIILSFINVESWLIYSIILANIFLAFLSSFSSPAYKAFTKEVVETEYIAQINSYLQTASTVVKILVPIIATWFYHIIGIHGILLVDGITFIFSASIIFLVTPIVNETKKNKKFSIENIYQDLVSGFKYLYVKKNILNLIILSAFINFFLAAYNLLLPYGNEMLPRVAGDIYSTFLTSEAIGGLVGAFFSGKINKQLSISKLMLYLGLSGFFISTINLFYLITANLFLIALAPTCFSIFLTIFNIQFFSFVQKDVGSEYLGRIFSIVFTVAILFMPLGTGIFTILLKPNFEYNFLFIGLSTMILSIVFFILFSKKFN